MFVKVENWRDKLNAHIEANRQRPFEWGQHDCALWAASCVEVTTGTDLGEPFRGRYKTAAGALKAIRKAGHLTPEALAEARVGPRQPPAFARAGDMVAADLKALGLAGSDRQIGLSLGICNGSVCWFVSDDGLVSIPTLSTECAFHGQSS